VQTRTLSQQLRDQKKRTQHQKPSNHLSELFAMEQQLHHERARVAELERALAQATKVEAQGRERPAPGAGQEEELLHALTGSLSALSQRSAEGPGGRGGNEGDEGEGGDKGDKGERGEGRGATEVAPVQQATAGAAERGTVLRTVMLSPSKVEPTASSLRGFSNLRHT
jgi:hypothetical protein